MSDRELQDLVTEIEEYQQKMEKAEVHMKSTASAFMSAHAATMEVFGVAGKVKYHDRFSKKGLRDAQDVCSVLWHLTICHFLAHVILFFLLFVNEGTSN